MNKKAGIIILALLFLGLLIVGGLTWYEKNPPIKKTEYNPPTNEEIKLKSYLIKKYDFLVRSTGMPMLDTASNQEKFRNQFISQNSELAKVIRTEFNPKTDEELEKRMRQFLRVSISPMESKYLYTFNSTQSCQSIEYTGELYLDNGNITDKPLSQNTKSFPC